MILRKFKNRLKQLAVWLALGRYHLLSSVTFIITGFYLAGILKFYPSVIALFMTMTGLLIILTQQILDSSTFGEHKPNTFTNWIKSFPTGKPSSFSIDGSVGSVAFGNAPISFNIAKNSTIERKIEFLLGRVEAIDTAIAELDDKVDVIKTTLNKTEKKLQSSIDTLSTSLNAIIASHVVGSYDLNLFGINITICGTVIQFFST